MSTKYTEDHEWIREQDGEFVVGITDYAQEQLGEIVFVDLPAVDAQVGKGQEAATVESVKAAGEVKSPASGSVTACNEQLADSPELVNQSPESDGWFYRMTCDDASQLDGLMDADAYKKFVESLG